MYPQRWLLLVNCVLLVLCVPGLIQCGARPSPAPVDQGKATPLPSPTIAPTALPPSPPPPSPTLSHTPAPPPTALPTGAPSPAPTNTAPPLPTATEAATEGPVIHYFRVNVDEVYPGDTIILEWESSGGTQAVLTPYTGGTIGFPVDVALSGTYTYKVPTTWYVHVSFILTVSDDTGRSVYTDLNIALSCATTWFFSPVPGGSGCPREPIYSDAAEQHFEHGTMIWVKEMDVVIVLYDEWGQYFTLHATFPDEWEEGDPESDPSITPPAGLYQPVRGFGLVWREKPDVRDRLGWAIDQEAGYSTIVQKTRLPKYNSIYILALDGNVWRVGPENLWEKVIVEK